jgi:alkyldihydroxyacetonephosphate synthase
VSDVVQRLEGVLGARVRSDEATRAAHRRDTWVLSELRDLEGRPGPLPLAVVEAASTDDVSRALAICRAARVPVVPFGGGSGVCGGIAVPEGAVVVSTRALAGLVGLDDRDLSATFRAGTGGMEAERRVEREGLTIGHWPQSIEMSTVGGWVATRAAGQFSTAYGSIEDVILDLEVVLPDGRVLRTRRAPRASAGPDLRQLFLGSEGTLGIVTEVTFSLRPLPELRRGQAFHFARFHEGLDPVRRLVRAGWRPPVVRLYDATESRRHFPETCPEGRAMLLLVHEGPAALVAAQLDAVEATCRDAGGVQAPASAADHWLEHRNQVPGFRSFLEKGIILDTIELACTWERAAELYDRVTASLAGVQGVLVASSHSSHSYRSGTCLYFTFVARPERREDMESTYRECWRRTLDACNEVGASISHHHGIGRVRRAALEREIGAVGVALLRAVKRALDPEGLMNPGVLLPPEPNAGEARTG